MFFLSFAVVIVVVVIAAVAVAAVVVVVAAVVVVVFAVVVAVDCCLLGLQALQLFAAFATAVSVGSSGWICDVCCSSYLRSVSINFLPYQLVCFLLFLLLFTSVHYH